jgi:HSP20 family molecular chaperone IbpA
MNNKNVPSLNNYFMASKRDFFNLESIIDNFFGDFLFKDFQTTVEGYPVANMFVNQKGDLKVEIATTGFEEKDVKVTIEGNVLSIKGSMEEKKEDEWCLVSGRLKKKTFEKHIRLSNKLDVSKAKAEFKNGTVQVVIPIKPEEEIKKIELL